MRILFLTLYFSPDIGANAVIVTELAEELNRLGHQVTVVTAFPHYAKNILDQDYRRKIITREKHKNIRVIRTYLFTSPKKERFLVRFLNYVSFNILSTLAGMFSGPQDLIIAPSPPLTIGLSAMIVGRLKRIPYIYNVQDINPDVLIKLGIIKNRLFIVFSKWLEKFVYHHAKKITVLSKGFQANLLHKGVPNDKISVIQNFVDPDLIQPGSKENIFSQEYNLNNKYVVLYAGNLGHSQYLENLIECASLLCDDGGIEFVIVGNGSREDYLKRMSESLGLRNLQFIPFQPMEIVPDIYASADISIVTLKKEIALDSVPSKILTIMASSRPVVAAVDEGSDAWQLVREANSGICIEPENPQALKSAVVYLKNNPEISREYGKNGREYILKYHTREMTGLKYHKVINEITKE